MHFSVKHALYHANAFFMTDQLMTQYLIVSAGLEHYTSLSQLFYIDWVVQRGRKLHLLMQIQSVHRNKMI